MLEVTLYLHDVVAVVVVAAAAAAVVVYLHDNSNIQMPIQKKNHANKVLKEVRNL